MSGFQVKQQRIWGRVKKERYKASKFIMIRIRGRSGCSLQESRRSMQSTVVFSQVETGNVVAVDLQPAETARVSPVSS